MKNWLWDAIYWYPKPIIKMLILWEVVKHKKKREQTMQMNIWNLQEQNKIVSISIDCLDWIFDIV